MPFIILWHFHQVAMPENERKNYTWSYFDNCKIAFPQLAWKAEFRTMLSFHFGLSFVSLSSPNLFHNLQFSNCDFMTLNVFSSFFQACSCIFCYFFDPVSFLLLVFCDADIPGGSFNVCNGHLAWRQICFSFS